MSEINRERVELLCQALESDRYKQGSGNLRTRFGYCCLGVACDVMDPMRWAAPGSSGDIIYAYERETGFLPRSVVEWYGFEDPSPTAVARDGCTWKLSTMNDGMMLSFKTIAEALRRTYLQPADEVTS